MTKAKVTKTPAGKVFDVRRPGKAPASATSRPVIVGHKPQVQDSVAGVSGIGASDNTRQPLLNTKKKIEVLPAGESKPKVIAPIEPLEPAGDEATTPVNVAVKEPAPAPEPQQPAKTPEVSTATVTGPPALPEEPASLSPEPEESPTEESQLAPELTAQSEFASLADPEPQVTPAAAPEVPASQPAKPEKTADERFEPWPEKPIQPSDSIPSEPMYDLQPIVVSHHSAASHVWKVILLLVVIVVLALVAVDILLDAGIVDWPIPHTNFLS